MKKLLASILDSCNELTWWPQLGMGCENAPDVPYDSAYWYKYVAMDNTPVGEKLTNARCSIVFDHYNGGDIVDVGIGGGRFVRDADCYGFDINPVAVEWLKKSGKYRNFKEGAEVLTFWDSLEHIRDPEYALKCAKQFAFVSLPIFADGESITKSRHYRPGEHFWYWTHFGFMAFAERCGFEVVQYSDMETQLGRESINTYALKRIR